MGAGKSTIGALLAQRAGCEFVDLDRYIEHKIGLSIPSIFEMYGELRFRNIEVEAIKDVITLHEISGQSVVIALGGGTLCTPSVQPLILERSTCIWLEVSPETVRMRLGDKDSGRPLLKEGWEQLMEQRRPIYEMARGRVKIDGKEAEEVCAEIENNYLSHTL